MAVLAFIFKESPHHCPWRLRHFTSPQTEHEVARVLVMGPVSVTWSFKVLEEEGQAQGNRDQGASSSLCGRGPLSRSWCRLGGALAVVGRWSAQPCSPSFLQDPGRPWASSE